MDATGEEKGEEKEGDFDELIMKGHLFVEAAEETDVEAAEDQEAAGAAAEEAADAAAEELPQLREEERPAGAATQENSAREAAEEGAASAERGEQEERALTSAELALAVRRRTPLPTLAAHPRPQSHCWHRR